MRFTLPISFATVPSIAHVYEHKIGFPDRILAHVAATTQPPVAVLFTNDLNGLSRAALHPKRRSRRVQPASGAVEVALGAVTECEHFESPQ
jgi:hypothetical protein